MVVKTDETKQLLFIVQYSSRHPKTRIIISTDLYDLQYKYYINCFNKKIFLKKNKHWQFFELKVESPVETDTGNSQCKKWVRSNRSGYFIHPIRSTSDSLGDQSYKTTWRRQTRTTVIYPVVKCCNDRWDSGTSSRRCVPQDSFPERGPVLILERQFDSVSKETWSRWRRTDKYIGGKSSYTIIS